VSKILAVSREAHRQGHHSVALATSETRNMKRVLSAMTLVTMLLVVRPASADSPTTVLNAVQNQGNTSDLTEVLYQAE